MMKPFIVCPNCRAKLAVPPEAARDRDVGCPKCSTIFKCSTGDAQSPAGANPQVRDTSSKTAVSSPDSAGVMPPVGKKGNRVSPNQAEQSKPSRNQDGDDQIATAATDDLPKARSAPDEKAPVQWFYLFMLDTIGPLTTQELRQHAQDGKITPDTHVRKGLAGEWFQAQRIRGLFEKLLADPDKNIHKPPSDRDEESAWSGIRGQQTQIESRQTTAPVFQKQTWIGVIHGLSLIRMALIIVACLLTVGCFYPLSLAFDDSAQMERQQENNIVTLGYLSIIPALVGLLVYLTGYFRCCVLHENYDVFPGDPRRGWLVSIWHIHTIVLPVVVVVLAICAMILQDAFPRELKMKSLDKDEAKSTLVRFFALLFCGLFYFVIFIIVNYARAIDTITRNVKNARRLLACQIVWAILPNVTLMLFVIGANAGYRNRIGTPGVLSILVAAIIFASLACLFALCLLVGRTCNRLCEKCFGDRKRSTTEFQSLGGDQLRLLRIPAVLALLIGVPVTLYFAKPGLFGRSDPSSADGGIDSDQAQVSDRYDRPLQFTGRFPYSSMNSGEILGYRDMALQKDMPLIERLTEHKVKGKLVATSTHLIDKMSVQDDPDTEYTFYLKKGRFNAISKTPAGKREILLWVRPD